MEQEQAPQWANWHTQCLPHPFLPRRRLSLWLPLSPCLTPVLVSESCAVKDFSRNILGYSHLADVLGLSEKQTDSVCEYTVRGLLGEIQPRKGGASLGKPGL